MLYGQVALTFAYLAFLAARGGEGLRRLSRVILILTAGHVVIFGYQLINRYVYLYSGWTTFDH